ncbi:uncharacterized protein MYCFIDRAFT_79086 [Pseudocercospora fijiensis CIRAD86]|uniref:Uncharacterized protein n=1 Tax=Pseudocercospora fijiensis (strain CIRAD86) TaxID=383855 RepID=M3A097_PSEFD|nr:uncharacterized protein MYCFIDRAFT_79086 [Pseudocercospora fijiensis CIRAD86]EME77826.1 hypothetical protein MYCFIDRAFT_79086 [Pseudocercospora fijiensis CIRAD86]
MAERSAMRPPPPPATNGERPKKRVRLSEDLRPSITTREMDDTGTALEVDHMILDYLVYQAINTCLAYQNAPRLDQGVSAVECSLVQANEFLQLFQHRYSRYRFYPDFRFRQQLLQLVTLVTQRLIKTSVTPPKASLQALRDRNKARAFEWIGRDASRMPTADYDTAPFQNELPLSIKKLEDNRAQLLDSLDIPCEDHDYDDAFFGTNACVTLLDVLPLFMQVSARCHNIFDRNNFTPQWMQLAADWMMHACLEQYLICGQEGSDAIDEAFAWGFHERDMIADETNIRVSDDPFDSEHDELDVQRWESIRRHALAKLFPAVDKNEQRDCCLVWHLGAVNVTNPVASLHANINKFLRDLAEAIEKPVLAQLETGQLDGMSKEETRNFLRECGLDVEKFYKTALLRMDTS